ncbi:MAG: hypothetical protein HS115_03840 [Spirochaetales bacterium]|nr:hypothetical protein [Spirochaetales bacterium]
MDNRHLLYPGLILFLGSCFAPVHAPVIRKPVKNLSGLKSAALFTFVERNVAVSFSQRRRWTLRIPLDDTAILKQKIREKIESHVALLPEQEILASQMVRSGSFPLREDFYSNPDALPVVATKEEAKLLQRFLQLHPAEAAFTILVDHSLTKLIFLPVRLKTELKLVVYDRHRGAVYSLGLSRTRIIARPEARSLKEEQELYGPLIKNAALDLREELLKELTKNLSDLFSS